MKCDHKFIDSKACLKCGWEPPVAPGKPDLPNAGGPMTEEIDRLAMEAREALWRACDLRSDARTAQCNNDPDEDERYKESAKALGAAEAAIATLADAAKKAGHARNCWCHDGPTEPVGKHPVFLGPDGLSMSCAHPHPYRDPRCRPVAWPSEEELAEIIRRARDQWLSDSERVSLPRRIARCILATYGPRGKG